MPESLTIINADPATVPFLVYSEPELKAKIKARTRIRATLGILLVGIDVTTMATVFWHGLPDSSISVVLSLFLLGCLNFVASARRYLPFSPEAYRPGDAVASCAALERARNIPELLPVLQQISTFREYLTVDETLRLGKLVRGLEDQKIKIQAAARIQAELRALKTPMTEF